MPATLKSIKSALLSLLPELIIIFLLIFTINNYIGNVDKTIKADAVGYYEYLPSLFIYHDLNRKDYPYEKNHSKYKRLDNFGHSFYNEYDGYLVNKYPCGTALLQTPFFWWEYINRSDDVSGYEYGFQRSVFFATIFYLFLGLVFFRKTLLLYDINRWIIFFCQLLVVFATPVLNFANFDAGFSHNYSFFAITTFCFFSRSFFLKGKLNHFLIASVFLGLIFLLRNPNLIIIGALPILAGNWSSFKLKIQKLFTNWKYLILGVILFLLITFIQLYIWYLQTGHFLVYSYQGEGFNFLDPHFLDVLFSYQKGLFIYTPVLFISLLASIWLLFKSNRFIGLSWLGFFILITYVFSSWWAWHYGASFGMRVYVDFLLILFLPLAILINKAKIHRAFKALLIISCTLCIPINIIQTYQYKEYILHWNQMDKESYWKVFLKTDPIYRGILWRKEVNIDNFEAFKNYTLSSSGLEKNEQLLVFSDTLYKEEPKVIRFSQTQDFNINDQTKLKVNVSQNNILVSNLETYLLHFEKEGFNKKHEGYYDMLINDFNSTEPIIIQVYLENMDNASKDIPPIHISYLRPLNK